MLIRFWNQLNLKVRSFWNKLNLKYRLLTGGAAVLVLAGLIFGVYRLFFYSAPAAADAAAETLQTSTVKQGDLVISASGTGVYVAKGTASLGFGSSGQITEVNVAVGDLVEKGQVLARMDDTAAQTAYKQAHRNLLNLTSPAAVASAQKAVAAAEDDVQSAEQSLMYLISPTVYSYELKLAAAQDAQAQAKAAAEADPSETNKTALATADAAVAKAQANVTAGWNWWRNTYVPQNFTVEEKKPGSVTKYVATPSDADILSTRADLTLAQATLAEAKNYLAAIQGGEIPDDATGSSLTAFEQAVLDEQNAQDTLDGMTLVAPISGIVTSLTANLGDTVSSGTVLTIADVSQVSLDFYLDETDFDKVAVGYPVEVIFDSLPDLTFTGKVTALDPSLSDQNGSKLIKGSLVLESVSPAVQGTLLLGMNASVDVIGGQVTGATLVSVDALHEIDTDQYGVYLLQDGTLHFTSIEVGLMDAFYAEVKSGLKPGDVVSTGLLESGQ